MEDNDLHPERALVIMAHPDDPEFSSGGTVAQWSREGCHVYYVIVTDGSKGSSDPDMTADELVRIRKSEQREAAQILGVRDVIFLGYVDGTIYNSPDLRVALARQIRTYRPEVVITHDPRARIIGDTRINHPDHLAVGDTVLDAIFPFARDRLCCPDLEAEGLAPHKVATVLLAMTGETNFSVDISNTLDAKINALTAHRSQIGDPDNLEIRIRERAEMQASDAGYQYAETFWRINLTR
jgi:LmbE family N-acetylglucosaminyl deacetylase